MIKDELEVLSDNELNKRVAIDVMGMRPCGEWRSGPMWNSYTKSDKCTHECYPMGSPPNYCNNMIAAMQVIVRLQLLDPMAIIRISNGDSDSMDIDILAHEYISSVQYTIEEGTFADAPRAISIASILSVSN